MTSTQSSTWLFFDAYSGEIRRTIDRHSASVAGCDDFVFEPTSSKAAYLAAGRVVVTHRAELLASYGGDMRVLRWGWAERMTSTGRIDAAFHEGQRLGLAHLMEAHVRRIAREDADRLAYIAMYLAQAVGVHVREENGRVEYIALFDRAHEHPSGRVVASSLSPAKAQTLPPPAPAARSREPRVPSPALIASCSRSALPILHQAFPAFREALIVVRVEPQGTKVRFFAHVSVLNQAGSLDVLTPRPEIAFAVRDLILAEHDAGNTEWHELVIRIAGTAYGGGVTVARFA